MMTPIEKAQEAYNNSRDPMECAITAFLDGILEDWEASQRIMDAIIQNQYRSTNHIVEAAIEALKQEAER